MNSTVYIKAFRLLTASAAMIAVLVGTSSASSRIGHVEASGQPLDLVLKDAVSMIKDRTEGRVSFTVFPSSQIGNAREMTESVQLGIQEAVVIPAAFIGGFNPLVSILDIPYLLPTNDEQAQQLRESEFGHALLDSFEDHGFEAVALWPGGFKHFTSNKPLGSITDFEGQKFRIMDSRVLRAQFEAVNASAVPIPFGDVYTALQTGVVEGQENPLDSIARMNFHEVQDYLLISAHGVVENVVLINPGFMASLSDHDQAVIRDTFVELSPVLGGVKNRNQNEALEQIKASGIAVRELSGDEQIELRERMYPGARDSFLSQSGDTGEALIELYEQSLERIVE